MLIQAKQVTFPDQWGALTKASLSHLWDRRSRPTSAKTFDRNRRPRLPPDWPGLVTPRAECWIRWPP